MIDLLNDKWEKIEADYGQMLLDCHRYLWKVKILRLKNNHYEDIRDYRNDTKAKYDEHLMVMRAIHYFLNSDYEEFVSKAAMKIMLTFSLHMDFQDMDGEELYDWIESYAEVAVDQALPEVSEDCVWFTNRILLN